MSKFERVLSDAWLPMQFKSSNEVPVLQRMINQETVKDIAKQAEQAVLAKLVEQEPVMYARTYYGEIDWDETCVTEKNDGALMHATDMRKEDFIRHGYAVIPLYAHPMPCVSPTSDKAACVSESGEIDTQIKERHRSTKNHIPNVGKMVVPHGYRLVSLADIDTAIQRASVFDDGGDGADPESARSCIEILKSMISSKAVDSLEPKKEVVHDRHTGKELLYIPPVGESLYSMAQARKESFSLALSVDTKEVQTLLQSYLDSLEGWQLVPREISYDMRRAVYFSTGIATMSKLMPVLWEELLDSAPKYTGENT